MNWQLGRVEHASLRAYRHGSETVVLEGMAQLPTPGYEAEFQPCKSLHSYQFYWREKPGTWPDVVTPRIIATYLASEPATEITVTDKDGEQTVTVEDQRELTGVSADGDIGKRATGLSDKFDLGEALRDAVNKLRGNVCDDLIDFRIIGAGGVYGGIAGVQELHITIERISADTPEAAITRQEAGNF